MWRLKLQRSYAGAWGWYSHGHSNGKSSVDLPCIAGGSIFLYILLRAAFVLDGSPAHGSKSMTCALNGYCGIGQSCTQNGCPDIWQTTRCCVTILSWVWQVVSAVLLGSSPEDLLIFCNQPHRHLHLIPEVRWMDSAIQHELSISLCCRAPDQMLCTCTWASVVSAQDVALFGDEQQGAVSAANGTHCHACLSVIESVMALSATHISTPTNLIGYTTM